ncbi:NUDIX hydrolase [Angomonas deanei]|uniref:NUDIX domain containing protein, putative n=1 Tax=Angomonas deanei TaxID=59799 RepID=A0A7G2C6Y5_9TRYP|nr:NUDIX hydrolase [Angomonas deanei]CAD2215235.1 NUDIX domain containing protein, putative [Angomonas deanei]|eukprot:EPY22030.1 NUDIX hydrolase [Angomonas deanei]
MRPAVTLVLLTGDKLGAIQVLMVKRHAGARFMPNVYVFPGGGVEPEDAHALTGTASAVEEVAGRRGALRELTEETGAVLGADGQLRVGSAPEPQAAARLLPLGRWLTPVAMRYQYDTRFYGAVVRHAVDTLPLVPQEREVSQLVWVTPQTALQDHEDPSSPFTLPPPTYLLLHALHRQSGFHPLADHWERELLAPRYDPQHVEGHYEEAYHVTRPEVTLEKGVMQTGVIGEHYFNEFAFPNKEGILSAGHYQLPNPVLKEKYVRLTVQSEHGVPEGEWKTLQH